MELKNNVIGRWVLIVSCPFFIVSCVAPRPLTADQVAARVSVDGANYDGDVVYKGPVIDCFGEYSSGINYWIRARLCATVYGGGSTSYFISLSAEDINYISTSFKYGYLQGHGPLPMISSGLNTGSGLFRISRKILEEQSAHGLNFQVNTGWGPASLFIPSEQIVGFLKVKSASDAGVANSGSANNQGGDFMSAGTPRALPVPGKPGFVFTPFRKNAVVDVRGIPSGRLARDPSTGGVFRVP
jgi:hypothetical protein